MKTEFKQVGTATGRLSSSNPNLQNIPVPKTADGQAARRAFIGTPEATFSVIKHAVAKQFEKMRAHTLYRVDLVGEAGASLSTDQRRAVTGDALWAMYLAAFPAGTNPVFRERTDHDCSCCRHFIKTMGGVVAIVNGEIKTLWDFSPTGTYYDAVAEKMDNLVFNAAIDGLFLHTEKSVGTEKNFATFTNLSGGMDNVVTWEHFHLHLPPSVVLKKDAVGPKLSESRATFDVFKRGLAELTLDAVDTVLELIAQNSLYRGSEYNGILSAFRAEKAALDIVLTRIANPHSSQSHAANRALDLFVWSRSQSVSGAVARIRNTAIGTLLIDLSGRPGEEPLELEAAVKKFETSIMAPSNYKRPTALVSKAMIAKAAETVEELGYTSALERRYAHIDDITVNNILFADRGRQTSVFKTLGAPYGKGVFADLAARVAESVKSLDKVEEVFIDKFLADILPRATSVEVMFENRHAGNLVSLVAPVDPNAKNMFKWANKFSWSYSGDVADSIKERVKKAGGSVTGDLCCRLAWDYTDDLDFHMFEPNGRINAHIWYAHRHGSNGGMLDVDANGGDGMREHPVENIVYRYKNTMQEGVYELKVHNFNRRSGGDGFEVEIEFGGETLSFHYSSPVKMDSYVSVAKIQYSKKDGFKIIESLPSTTAVKQVWNLQTQTFRKVNMVMLSPNYWDGVDKELALEGSRAFGVGNKHYFFMLERCRNEDKARGFYNEFLSAELEPHRKTMEMVGARMKTDESDRQLSGLGFSSTQRNTLLARVEGTFTRIVKVTF